MKTKNLLQIDICQHVTVDHHKRIVFKKRLGLFESAAGSQYFFFPGKLQAYSEIRAAAEMLDDFIGQVMDIDDDVLNALGT